MGSSRYISQNPRQNSRRFSTSPIRSHKFRVSTEGRIDLQRDNAPRVRTRTGNLTVSVDECCMHALPNPSSRLFSLTNEPQAAEWTIVIVWLFVRRGKERRKEEKKKKKIIIIFTEDIHPAASFVISLSTSANRLLSLYQRHLFSPGFVHGHIIIAKSFPPDTFCIAVTT